MTKTVKKTESAVKAAETVKAPVAPVEPKAVKETKAVKESKPAAKTVKTTAAAKPAAKAKKAPAKETSAVKVFVEYQGRQMDMDAILEAVKAAAGVKSPKTLEVYVKPEDGAAYYVVNGKDSGKAVL